MRRRFQWSGAESRVAEYNQRSHLRGHYMGSPHLRVAVSQPPSSGTGDRSGRVEYQGQLYTPLQLAVALEDETALRAALAPSSSIVSLNHGLYDTGEDPWVCSPVLTACKRRWTRGLEVMLEVRPSELALALSVGLKPVFSSTVGAVLVANDCVDGMASVLRGGGGQEVDEDGVRRVQAEGQGIVVDHIRLVRSEEMMRLLLPLVVGPRRQLLQAYLSKQVGEATPGTLAAFRYLLEQHPPSQEEIHDAEFLRSLAMNAERAPFVRELVDSGLLDVTRLEAPAALVGGILLHLTASALPSLQELLRLPGLRFASSVVTLAAEKHGFPVVEALLRAPACPPLTRRQMARADESVALKDASLGPRAVTTLHLGIRRLSVVELVWLVQRGRASPLSPLSPLSPRSPLEVAHPLSPLEGASPLEDRLVDGPVGRPVGCSEAAGAIQFLATAPSRIPREVVGYL